MTIRQAIITFDAARVAQWDTQAEDRTLAWIFKQAITGKPYAAERGIVSIELVEPEPSPSDEPVTMIDVPIITLGPCR